MTRRSLFHVLAPVVAALLLVLTGWIWLRTYTRHDVAVKVPDLKGMTLQEAGDVLERHELLVEVIDSVYNDEAPKGTVVVQDPPADREVKPDRRVYVVMNAREPKMINMPALVNLSKRQAISVMEIVGLKVKDMQYRPDPCVDCGVAQLHKGQPIAAEARVRRGEAITLVLGSGANGERVLVPDLRGSSMTDVRMVLNMSSLNLGVVVECRGCNTSGDSAFARVFRQSPAASSNNFIAMGAAIDIWLDTDTAGLKPVFNWQDSLIQRNDTNAVD
jgi:eukaryotic-like serine/threonine-protein kinase